MSGPDLRGHVHAVQHAPNCARGTAVCECGATVRMENAQTVGEWHTCETCTPAFYRVALNDAHCAGVIGAAPGPVHFWHPDLPEIGGVDSGNLEGACVTAPAPAGWDGVEGTISHPLPRLDAAVAALIGAAPGPGSVRPWGFWWGIAGLYADEVAAMSRRLALAEWEPLAERAFGSVGPFPVEPPPGLSAAQRRLVGEGWAVEALWVAGWAYMLSPGGVHMWVEPSGRQHIGQPSEVTYPNGSRVVFDDDGAAARVARERNGDKLELPDGRVQGVDRG